MQGFFNNVMIGILNIESGILGICSSSCISHRILYLCFLYVEVLQLRVITVKSSLFVFKLSILYNKSRVSLLYYGLNHCNKKKNSTLSTLSAESMVSSIEGREIDCLWFSLTLLRTVIMVSADLAFRWLTNEIVYLTVRLWQG